MRPGAASDLGRGAGIIAALAFAGRSVGITVIQRVLLCITVLACLSMPFATEGVQLACSCLVVASWAAFVSVNYAFIVKKGMHRWDTPVFRQAPARLVFSALGFLVGWAVATGTTMAYGAHSDAFMIVRLCMAFALVVVVMLFFAGAMYLAGKFALGKSPLNTTVKGAAGASAVRRAGWRRFVPTGVFLFVTLLAALPHIALVLTSFSMRWYNTILPREFTLLHFENALSDKIVLPSIVNSLHYSLLAMVIAVAVGVLVSLAAVRWKLWGSTLADLLAMLPLAVPGIIIAFGYLGMSVRFKFAAEYFNPVENPFLLLGIAYAVRRLPYVVRSVSAGLEQTPEELENAARSFGATAFATLRKVTLPLVFANVIVGALFAFSFSMLEVSDSLILAQKAQFYPITRAIYDLSQVLGSGPYIACAFGVWAMLFLAATLAAAGAMLGSRIGSIFKL